MFAQKFFGKINLIIAFFIALLMLALICYASPDYGYSEAFIDSWGHWMSEVEPVWSSLREHWMRKLRRSWRHSGGHSHKLTSMVNSSRARQSYQDEQRAFRSARCAGASEDPPPQAVSWAKRAPGARKPFVRYANASDVLCFLTHWG